MEMLKEEAQERDKREYNCCTGHLDWEHGFQSKPIPAKWPRHWEVTDWKDTSSDQLRVAIRAYFGATEMLEMMKEQTEENFERKTIWDCCNFLRDSYRDEDSHGQRSGQGQKHGCVIEEMTELLTGQASDFMFVRLAEAEGFLQRERTYDAI